MSNTNGNYAKTPYSKVIVREATPADGAALARLADLDSARVPAAPLLVAETDGELRAAISVLDGSVVADPFHPSAELVAILRMRAGAEPARGPSRLAALWGRGSEHIGPRPSAPSVPGLPVLPSRSL